MYYAKNLALIKNQKKAKAIMNKIRHHAGNKEPDDPQRRSAPLRFETMQSLLMTQGLFKGRRKKLIGKLVV